MAVLNRSLGDKMDPMFFHYNFIAVLLAFMVIRVIYQRIALRTRGNVEFREGKVFRETQYFGDPFEPWSGRARWVEPINEPTAR